MNRINCTSFWLLLTAIGLFTGFSVRGDDTMFHQAHDLLHQALGGDDGTPVSAAQQLDLLNQAEKILKNAPPGRYGHHRKHAIQYIRSSKEELQLGDPNKKATEYIREADSEVRYIE